MPLSEEASYLVCTGGLTDPVPSGVLDEVLRRHEDGRAVFELWKATIEVGGPDNVTRAWCASPPRAGAAWARRRHPSHAWQVGSTVGTDVRPARRGDHDGPGRHISAVTGQRHAAEHADVERRHADDHAQVSQRHLAAHEELYARHGSDHTLLASRHAGEREKVADATLTQKAALSARHGAQHVVMEIWHATQLAWMDARHAGERLRMDQRHAAELLAQERRHAREDRQRA